MKQELIEGSVYGVLAASTAYIVVHFMGFSPQTLPILLYFYVISGILINLKAELDHLSIPYMKRLVLVAEGEEMKLKRLLTGEEYKVNGQVEKV